MSSGRGRGYSGRHHLQQREPRPGDPDLEELNAARTLAELSPRATDPSKIDLNKIDLSKYEDAKEEKQPVKEKVEKARVTNEDEVVLKDLLFVDEQYAPLLVLLEQFSPGEDGIQFNRKLRQFETAVTNMCPDETRLQSAFATFRAAALQSGATARRLAAVGASFTRQQRQQLLRAPLLNVVMQGTFTKLDILERANPIYLINATNLMGDYFAEARLCNGNKVHILASPLLQYMRALLASDDLRAHRSLATQLMQNGRELLTVLSQELDELSISIRLRLLTPPPVSVIWLLLSADLCLNKFLPLPNTLQQFYAAHLELTTDDSFSEVTYGSWKKSREEYQGNSSLEEKVGQNLSQLNISQEEDTKPKLRPILGAGAGLLRQEQMAQEFDTWTGKTSLSKRYDLNSWRQTDEKKEEAEPVFNPNVLPPNMQNFPTDYPPPNFNYPENYANYLQQGDGTYIQNVQSNSNNFPQSEFVPQYERTQPERVNNEIQKTANTRRVVENWRMEKPEQKEDPNKNRRNRTRQKSRDNINSEDDRKDERRSTSRNSTEAKANSTMNRRNSGEDGSSRKRNESDVPRGQKYWDHDDRYYIEYS